MAKKSNHKRKKKINNNPQKKGERCEKKKRERLTDNLVICNSMIQLYSECNLHKANLSVDCRLLQTLFDHFVIQWHSLIVTYPKQILRSWLDSSPEITSAQLTYNKRMLCFCQRLKGTRFVQRTFTTHLSRSFTMYWLQNLLLLKCAKSLKNG